MATDLPTLLNGLVELVNKYADNEPTSCRKDIRGLINKIIEEAYELEEAYDANSITNTKEEIGDLIFFFLLFSIRASEENLFSLSDIIKSQSQKLFSRNIFLQNPDTKYSDNEVLEHLVKVKSQEPGKVDRTFMESVPHNIPPFLRSQIIQNKAAEMGYYWDNADQSFDKLLEGLYELNFAVQLDSDSEEIKDELGDLFFSLINYSRFLNVDPSSAISHANKKFISRVMKMKSHLDSINKTPADFSIQELNDIWEQVKNK